MVGLLAAIGTAMSALIGFSRGNFVWVTIAVRGDRHLRICFKWLLACGFICQKFSSIQAVFDAHVPCGSGTWGMSGSSRCSAGVGTAVYPTRMTICGSSGNRHRHGQWRGAA